MTMDHSAIFLFCSGNTHPSVAINAPATLLVTLSVNGGRDFRRPRRRSGNKVSAAAAIASPHLDTSIAEPPLNNSMQPISLKVVYNQSCGRTLT